jgi:hypothetical protein
MRLVRSRGKRSAIRCSRVRLRAKGGEVPLAQAHFAHHGAHRHGHQAAEGVIAFAFAPVGKIAKKSVHLLKLCRGLRTLRSLVLLAGLAGHGQIAAPQNRARTELQFPHPKLLGLVMPLIKILA